MNLIERAKSHNELLIVQRHELAELFGYETRNKYSIETPNGEPLGFAAEQQKGFLGFLIRQFLGHWRKFEIHFFNADRSLAYRAVHPFRWFFQRLEVYDVTGGYLGALQQRFAIFSKKLDVEDANGRVLMEVSSPLWRIWTFEFKKNISRVVARIEKKWSGALSEMFTDKDRFRVTFVNPDLTETERTLLIAAGVFIDLQYFERKAN